MAAYPSVPKFNYSYGLEQSFKTLISEFDGGNEQRRRLLRFPKRSVTLVYKNLLKASRDTIHDWYSDYYGAYGDSSGNLFYFFDQALRHWKDEYVGRGTGGALTLDLHSKTTTSGATLVIYEAGVAQTVDVDYTFVSGGGTEGADRITWIVGHYPATGCLITSDFNGYLRVKARFAEDGWSEEIPTFSAGVPVFNFQVKISEVQW